MAEPTVTMGQLQRMAEGVRAVDDASQRSLARALGSIDLTDRRAVSAVLSGTVMAGAGASSQLAAAFYRGMSLLQTGEDFDADGAFAYDSEAAEVALSGMYRQADGDMDKLARLLGERLSFEVNRAAKVAVWRNGQRDQRDVRYARVPTGPETCAWCLMTAGLGYWYMSAEAASHTHRGCDCQIVPSIGIHAVRIDGYDSTVYRDMWRTANQMRANGDIPDEWLDHIDRVGATREAQGRPYRADTNGTLFVMRKMYGLK